MSTEQMILGLKHYRRIAKQDVLRAAETANPEAFRVHAEARREVYAQLAETAATLSSEDIVEKALQLYRSLPFVSGTAETEYPEIKGRENALENFFLMVGLDPKTRREARKERKRIEASA